MLLPDLTACSSHACDLKHHPNRLQCCGFPQRRLAAGASCGSYVAVILVPEPRGSSLLWAGQEGKLVLLFMSSLSISPALLTGQGPGAEVRKLCLVAYCYTDINPLMACCSANVYSVTASCCGGVLVNKVKSCSG